MKLNTLFRCLALLPAFLLLTACPPTGPDPDPTPTTSSDVSVLLGQSAAITGKSLAGAELQPLLEQQADGTLAFRCTNASFTLPFDLLKDYNAEKPFSRYVNYPIDRDFDLGSKPTVPYSAGESIDLSGYLPSVINLGSRSTGQTIYFQNLPEEVIALEDIELTESSHFSVTLSITKPFFTEGTVIPEFDVDMRSFFNSPEAENGILHFDAPMTAENGYKVTKSFALDGVPFDPANFDPAKHNLRFDARVGLSGKVHLEGMKTTRTRLAAAPANMVMNVTVLLLDVACKSVTGRFSYTSKAATGSMKLPSGLTALALEPASAAMQLDLTSNMSVPARAGIGVTSRKSRRVIGEVTGFATPLTVAGASGSSSTQFQLHQAGDLSPLFARMPDEFIFTATASALEDESCTVVLGQENSVELTPTVWIPFAPGSEYKTEVADTLSVPSSVGAALKSQSLELQGEVVNTLPFDVEMTATLIDDSGRVLSRDITQTLAAGTAATVKQTVNPLGTSTEAITKMRIVYQLKGTATPRAIKAADKLQAILSIKIPGSNQ